MIFVEVWSYPYHAVVGLLLLFCGEGEIEILTVCVLIHRDKQAFDAVF